MAKRDTLQKVTRRLARMDWDVGDQGRDSGFFALYKGRAYHAYIEGWGEECLDPDFDPEEQMEALQQTTDEWMQRFSDAGYAVFQVPPLGNLFWLTIAVREDIMANLGAIHDEDIIRL